jgi:flagellar biosynthetic protein FlhB
VAPPDDDGRERTEQPSARRREEARRRGQVAKSADLTGALLVLGAVAAHAAGGGHVVADGLELVRRGLVPRRLEELSVESAAALLQGAAWDGVRVAWPFLVIPTLAGVGGHLLQTRFLVATEGVAPQWSRLSPLAGFGRLWSLRSLAELVRSLLKLAALGTLAALTLYEDWALLVGLGEGGGAAAAMAAVGRVVWDLWLRVGLAYLAIGALDYAYQWWQHERSLRMTRQEVREEARETEGDPHLRGRMRGIHRQMVTRRMAAEVARATVVVRNPVHVAVALRYDGGAMAAPRVVAKGERLVALRIVDLARRHGVPVVENPPLARALHRAVEIGREIPPDLYRAVAELLAHVYALAGRRA